VRRSNPKEIDAILSLDGAARFAHFVKRVVDEERAWGLWKDGWALMSDAQGMVFPLWPAREYAERCRLGEWADYEPREILLEDLLDGLIPMLETRDVRPAVFPTPTGKGVTVRCTELASALNDEGVKYA